VNNVVAAAKSRCPHGDRVRQQIPQTATKAHGQKKCEVQAGSIPRPEQQRTASG
jgi:hypothetical protein